MPTEPHRDDSLSRALHALGNPVRRRLLARLHDAAPGAGVALDSFGSGDGVPFAVYHVHLPKLEGVGYVEATTDPVVAYRGPRFEEVAAVMRALESNAGDLPGEWP
jgi:DNA-binding transcriptional ArsR family regulator